MTATLGWPGSSVRIYKLIFLSLIERKKINLFWMHTTNRKIGTNNDRLKHKLKISNQN